jgi:hypothetical protein
MTLLAVFLLVWLAVALVVGITGVALVRLNTRRVLTARRLARVGRVHGRRQRADLAKPAHGLVRPLPAQRAGTLDDVAIEQSPRHRLGSRLPELQS